MERGFERILVACGTGAATSAVIAGKIETALKERGIDVEISYCKETDIKTLAQGVDLVVTTFPVTFDLGVPVIQTLAFLTGMGKEEAIEQIIAAIQD